MRPASYTPIDTDNTRIGNVEVLGLRSGSNILNYLDNGYFELPGVGGLSYYPVTPCRIADTRAGSGFTGAFGTPSLTTGASRTFPIPASACSIPSSGAYALNFTAVPTAQLGYLSAGPAGSPQPNVSTLNSWDAQVVANLAIVPAGTGGAITTWISGATDLVLDSTGYFRP